MPLQVSPILSPKGCRKAAGAQLHAHAGSPSGDCVLGVCRVQNQALNPKTLNPKP